MLEEILPATVFSVLLVFARVGGALMLMPGFGEAYVPARSRLILALVISVVVSPVLLPVLPVLPTSAAVLFVLILGEIFVGVFLGALARMIMGALTTAGMALAYMSALANALVNDPAVQQQGSIAGSFLSITALLLIFVLDLHHLILAAIIDSYALFPPGDLPPVGDFSQMISRVAADSFHLGVKLATPFLVVGLLFYLGVGLLARLMPQVQIFFVVMPLQLYLGFAMFAISLPVMLGWFLGVFEDTLLSFTSG